MCLPMLGRLRLLLASREAILATANFVNFARAHELFDDARQIAAASMA